MTEDGSGSRRRQRHWLWFTTAAMAVAVAMLVAGTVQYARQADLANRELSRQTELNHRVRQMQAILITLGNAETGQRGYLLTGKLAYLAPYTDAVARMPGLLRSLEGMLLAAPGLQGQVRVIEDLATRKLGELAETIHLYDDGQREAALQIVNSDVGRDYMDRVRLQLNAAMEVIQTDRDEATRQMVLATEASRRSTIATVAALVVSIVVAGVQIVLLTAAQRRHAEELSESETRHRAIVEEQQELVSLAREDGTLTYVNPAYARAFGREPDEMVGTSLYDYVVDPDRDGVRRLLGTVFRSGEPAHDVNRMASPDGREMWIAWTNSLQRGADGERVLHSVGRDVTQHKQAAEALKASEDFLARTGRVAGVGGWELDLRTDDVRWSDQIRLIHEVPRDFQPTLESAIRFYAPEARQTLRQAIEASRREGKGFDVELALVTAKGRRICVRAVGEVERDDRGSARLAGALQDITARKELEEQVAASERFVREVTDSLPVRIAYLDREARYRFINDAELRHLGATREEAIGKRHREVARNPLPAATLDKVEAAFKGEPQRFEYEEVVDGTVRHLQTQLIPDIDANGQVKGLFTTGIDVTALKTSERTLRELADIIDHTTDFVVQTDWTGRVQFLNPSVREALGFAADEPPESHVFTEFNTAETNERYAAEIAPAVKRDGIWVGETTVLAAGGRVVPVSHMVIGHRSSDGRIARYSAVMRDISQVITARRALQEQTATLGAIVEAIPAMVAVFDDQFRYRLVNRAFERWRGTTRHKVLGRRIDEVFGPAEYERSLPWAKRALAGETVSYEKDYPEAVQHRFLTVNYMPLRLEDGSVAGFVSVAQDITVQRDEEKRLLSLAERDALTGALNRTGFNNYLAQRKEAFAMASVALLYIDLDRFKPVNDTYGHTVGDELLRQFAQRLRELVRPTDAVARLGGDEFAIVLNDVRARENAETVADKVVESAQRPFGIGPLQVTVGASVGVAFGLEEDSGWQGLVERADAAVYRAKAAGRGQRA